MSRELLRCTKCDGLKPTTAFSRARSSVRGYQYWCRVCHAEYTRARAEHYQRYQAEYYVSHKKRVNARNTAWYYANRGLVLTTQRRYRATHEAQERVRHAKYHATPRGRDVRKRALAKYHATPKGRAQLRAKCHRRRVRARSGGVNFTGKEWLELCEKSRWRCKYCGRRLNIKTVVQEHMTPLSRGGLNHIGNLAVACATCNRRKGVRTVAEYEALLAA